MRPTFRFACSCILLTAIVGLPAQARASNLRWPDVRRVGHPGEHIDRHRRSAGDDLMDVRTFGLFGDMVLPGAPREDRPVASGTRGTVGRHRDDAARRP